MAIRAGVGEGDGGVGGCRWWGGWVVGWVDVGGVGQWVVGMWMDGELHGVSSPNVYDHYL